MGLIDAFVGIYNDSGLNQIIGSFLDGGYKTVIMLVISCGLLYLAIVKKYEPLLLLPIAFGMLLANLPLANLIATKEAVEDPGLMWYLYRGVAYEIFPPLIFLGIGCMTDFGPLIANPSSLLLGAGRNTKEDVIDPTAGIYLQAKTGDYVKAGDPIAIMYSEKQTGFKAAAERLLAATRISETTPKAEPLILE